MWWQKREKERKEIIRKRDLRVGVFYLSVKVKVRLKINSRK